MQKTSKPYENLLTIKCMLKLYTEEVNKIKNITLRVSDDFHYSVKMYASKIGIPLQSYMIETVEKDLNSKNAYVKSPDTIAGMLISEMLDGLSDDELLAVIKRAKEEKNSP